jgi:transcription elongation factor Elf1
VQHYTRSVTCPVCGGQAVLAVIVRRRNGEQVNPNDVGLTCETGCRPTVDQIQPLIAVGPI